MWAVVVVVAYFVVLSEWQLCSGVRILASSSSVKKEDLELLDGSLSGGASGGEEAHGHVGEDGELRYGLRAVGCSWRLFCLGYWNLDSVEHVIV